MSCRGLGGEYVGNTIYVQEGLESCIAEYGENCGGTFTTRLVPDRLCVDKQSVENEQARIERGSGGRIDCTPPEQFPSQCEVKGEVIEMTGMEFFTRTEHLSCSQCCKFSRCPRLWFYQYGCRMSRGEEHPALVFGKETAIDTIKKQLEKENGCSEMAIVGYCSECSPIFAILELEKRIEKLESKEYGGKK